jgi:hypothetical protein
MEDALRRGVTIKIVYGLGRHSQSKAAGDDETPEAAERLKSWFGQFGSAFRIMPSAMVTNRDGTHVKLLLCDERHYVFGSYNFLSFRGDYDKGGRDECAELSRNAENLRGYRAEYFAF